MAGNKDSGRRAVLHKKAKTFLGLVESGSDVETAAEVANLTPSEISRVAAVNEKIIEWRKGADEKREVLRAGMYRAFCDALLEGDRRGMKELYSEMAKDPAIGLTPQFQGTAVQINVNAKELDAVVESIEATDPAWVDNFVEKEI